MDNSTQNNKPTEISEGVKYFIYGIIILHILIVMIALGLVWKEHSYTAQAYLAFVAAIVGALMLMSRGGAAMF